MLSLPAARAGLRAPAQLASVSRNAALNGTRTYAAPAAANQNVKPPIALFGIDGIYANALVRGPLPLPLNVPLYTGRSIARRCLLT